MDLHAMYAQGLSMREIARRTGHDRKTIRKYLQLRELPRYKARPLQPSMLDPFKDYLLSRVANGVCNANRLLLELRARGYTGGKTILKDFLKPLRPPRRPPATVRFETRPGEQAQVDFGVFPYEDDRGRHRLFAFVMVLSYSRMLFVEFVERQDTATLLRCHAHAFEALGGVPERILYDNLKPVVLGRDDGGRPVWNPRFIDFALLVGYQPQLCRPYRAQTKGRVERAIAYLRSSFWPGVRFATLADLNEQVRTWCAAVANRRLHGTTGRRPCDLSVGEGLRPAPSRMVLAPLLAEERRVSRDGFVSYGGSRYVVPWTLAGCTVLVREAGPHVEILAGGGRIALHPKAVLPGTVVPLSGQWDGLAPAAGGRQREFVGLRIPAPEVEVRPLDVYAALLGADA